MILCVGALGSGKSTLLKILQQHGQDLELEAAKDEEDSAASESKPGYSPVTTPTMGTDLLSVTQSDK